jgi:hypothetical protein
MGSSDGSRVIPIKSLAGIVVIASLLAAVYVSYSRIYDHKVDPDLIAHAKERAPDPYPFYDPDPFANYDPAKCTQDAHGKRYIVLGADIFAILPDPAFLAGASYLGPKCLLIPPNPNDPLGCPGNPNQLSLTFPIKAVLPNLAEVQKKDGIEGRRLGLFSMRGCGVEALKAANSEIPQVYRDHPYLSKATCALPGVTITFEKGAEICRWGLAGGLLWPKTMGTRPDPIATSFNAYPPRYSTPLGYPFRVHCGVKYMGPCTVLLEAAPNGLVMGYEFFPALSLFTPDYLDRIIDYDRQLWAAVNAAIVPDYPWPQRVGVNSEKK